MIYIYHIYFFFYFDRSIILDYKLFHFNTGNGWFLDKIVIKYKEGKEVQEVVFPCNRYVIHGEAELVCYILGNLGKIL